MVRGVVPRQPAKTGRHEGARTVSRGQRSRGPSRQPKHSSEFPSSLSQGPRQKSKTEKKAYNPLAPERIQEILKRLDQQYPDVTCALQHKSAWELLVATILSAQATDVRVNMVTPEIFKKYPTVADFAALRPEQLEPDIRSTGFFRNKSVRRGRGQKDHERFRRPGSRRDGKNPHFARCSQENGERGVGYMVRRVRRRSRRYPCPPGIAPAGTDQIRRSQKDRARLDEDYSPRPVDFIFSPDHLAWPQTVHRAIAEMRGVSPGKYLPCCGQDLDDGRNPQEREALSGAVLLDFFFSLVSNDRPCALFFCLLS